MSLDIFKNLAEPDACHFKGLEWQEGHLKALISTPFGDICFDRSELLAQPFRSIPAYHNEALGGIESEVAPLFERVFMQGKHLLYATVLSKNLFEFQFIDWKRKIHPDGKHFQITRQEASKIYSDCTENSHITRGACAKNFSGGMRQILRKNIVTLGFLCRTDKLAEAIFWQRSENDKITVPGAERIMASRSTLSAIFNMGTEAARPYVEGRFKRRPPAPPEFA